ncbi:DUF680 domain-containing protein [Aminobacter sp. HY435]|uniref:DUF680 domain-containing protein n=1 Tax=Aminobacter sp. HY435 TaxID=2970917 RepID=UPI0022B98235|nr:DUF680 domain-containing protein [Aminobacter sp. HY435]
MKRTVLALATVIAATGFAMAKDAQGAKPRAPAACTQTMKQKLDCTPTGSISQDKPPATTNSIGDQKPRLGIGIDPWIMPTFN